MREELESLLAALEASPEDWTLMRVVADWHEDQGDLVAAQAWRWLAQERKRPYRAFGNENQYHWYDGPKQLNPKVDPESNLTTALFEALPALPPYETALFRQYGSRRESFLDFVAAWRKSHA